MKHFGITPGDNLYVSKIDKIRNWKPPRFFSTEGETLHLDKGQWSSCPMSLCKSKQLL